MAKAKVFDDSLCGGTYQMPARVKALEESRPYSISIKLTSKCAGGCNYCYINSTEEGDAYLETDRLLRLFGEMRQIGAEMILWHGGDPLLHPDFFELCLRARDSGFIVTTLSSGLIPAREARQLVRLHQDGAMEMIGLHLDTIDPEAYRKINSHPQTLQKKIQGYQNLREAGFPPQKILGLLTLTQPVCETIELTMDWYIDQMGVREVGFCIFEPEGFGWENRELEPSVSDLKRAFEYRARRLGEQYLRIGSSDLGALACRTYFAILYDGGVVPCVQLPELVMGNIYQESLMEIFQRNRDALLFNFEVHGPCASCQNNDVCFGCRASAYHYLGDIRASDPKCWLNPQAREYAHPAEKVKP